MDEDFWLPEFQLSPTASTEEIILSPSTTKRGHWLKKTMEVLMRDEGSEFLLNLQVLRSVAPTVPPCSCFVCRLVNNMTVQSPKEVLNLLKNLELVDHGRQRLTVYDKNRPWLRQHVQNCTNPRPLARRMPSLLTGRSEAVNAVHRLKMMPPGKVIQDPKKHSRN